MCHFCQSHFCQIQKQKHFFSSIKNIYKYTAKRSVGTSVLAAPGTSYIIPEPMGVVLVIGAWNYPIFTCIP